MIILIRLNYSLMTFYISHPIPIKLRGSFYTNFIGTSQKSKVDCMDLKHIFYGSMSTLNFFSPGSTRNWKTSSNQIKIIKINFISS
jgi:hypothetical protein